MGTESTGQIYMSDIIRLRSRVISLLIAFTLSICLSIGLSKAMATDGLAATEYDWNLPEWTPKPVVPDNNPMTAAKVELGRHLFYEPRLSITGRIFLCLLSQTIFGIYRW